LAVSRAISHRDDAHQWFPLCSRHKAAVCHWLPIRCDVSMRGFVPSRCELDNVFWSRDRWSGSFPVPPRLALSPLHLGGEIPCDISCCCLMEKARIDSGRYRVGQAHLYTIASLLDSIAWILPSSRSVSSDLRTKRVTDTSWRIWSRLLRRLLLSQSTTPHACSWLRTGRS